MFIRFLHAALQLDALCDRLSSQEVKNTLEAFPSTIEDVYHHTWDRISNQSPNQVSVAKTMLIWVLHAAGSMTVEELERAMATSPTSHKCEASHVVHWTTLLSLCRGLVTIEEESKIVRLVRMLPFFKTPLVRALIHLSTDSTAKDILEGLLHESFPHPHSLLAAVCITYLTRRGFQNTTIDSKEEFVAALEKDPLLAYTSEAWAYHARAGLELEDTKRRTAQLVCESHAFPAYTSLEHNRYFDILTPLHVLALYDLPLSLIATNILGNRNITTPFYQQSPLFLACMFGSETVVLLLVGSSETQVNLADADGWSPLLCAVRLGHERSVKLLLAHPEIQVNSVTILGWSALMLAALYGYERIIRLLLSHPKIQVNLAQDEGWTALLGTNEGYEEIVKLLLALPGIEINQANDQGSTPLMLAAQKGHEGIARLLLAFVEIQVNLADSSKWSALMLAARHGSEGVGMLLLERSGIQVNQVNEEGWSALMQAADQGYEGMAKLFLAHPEIQVNPVNKRGWSALLLAAERGHEGVLPLLLAQPGVDVNLLNHGGWAAFILASDNGREGVVKLLLADPRVQIIPVESQARTSALLLAAEHGHTAVVEHLLPTGAFDINAVNGDGDTAIRMAAEKGHEDVVRKLLAVPNVDPTIISTTDGHTAMSVAQFNSHGSIVALLQDFESQKVGNPSPSGISRLFLSGVSSGTHKDDSDSDSLELYQDAEEELEREV